MDSSLHKQQEHSEPRLRSLDAPGGRPCVPLLTGRPGSARHHGTKPKGFETGSLFIPQRPVPFKERERERKKNPLYREIIWLHWDSVHDDQSSSTSYASGIPHLFSWPHLYIILRRISLFSLPSIFPGQEVRCWVNRRRRLKHCKSSWIVGVSVDRIFLIGFASQNVQREESTVPWKKRGDGTFSGVWQIFMASVPLLLFSFLAKLPRSKQHDFLSVRQCWRRSVTWCTIRRSRRSAREHSVLA